MKYKVIILIAVVLCLSMATISSAIRYEDRYTRAVMQDDPNLYMKFDDFRPMDYSRVPHAFVGYIRNEPTEGEPNETTKLINAGGIGKSLLLDPALLLGTTGGGHKDSGAYAYNTRFGLGGTSQYGTYGDQYAFNQISPLSATNLWTNPPTGPNGGDISIEFWYKTCPAGEPQPDAISYFVQQFGAGTRAPIGPGVGIANGQFRVCNGPKFFYPGVDAHFDEQWHQVVVTYDERYLANNASTRTQFYFDGQFVAEEVVTNIGANITTNPGFETAGLTGWSAEGGATITRVDNTVTAPMLDTYCAQVSNRTATTAGIKQSLLGITTAGWTYRISAYGKLGDGNPDPCDTFNISIIKTDGSGTSTTVVATEPINKIDWTRVPNTEALGDVTGANYTLNVTGTLTQLDLVYSGPAVGSTFYADGQVTTSYMTGTSVGLKNVWAGRGRLGAELISMTIGAANDRGQVYNCFGGYMDELAVYHRVIDANSVLAHYNAFQPQSCEEVWARGNPNGGWDRDWDGEYREDDGRPKSGHLHIDVIQGQNVGLLADLDQDCYVDLADYAIFATDWAKCNEPGGSGCVENW